jgi:hypothetical protein
MMRRMAFILTILLGTWTIASAQSGGQICVRAFEDRNGSGSLDSGEPLLIGGISVSLLDQSGTTVASGLLDESPTAAQGVICFQSLPAGQYSVVITSSYVATTPETININLADDSLPTVVEYGGQLVGQYPIVVHAAQIWTGHFINMGDGWQSYIVELALENTTDQPLTFINSLRQSLQLEHISMSGDVRLGQPYTGDGGSHVLTNTEYSYPVDFTANPSMSVELASHMADFRPDVLSVHLPPGATISKFAKSDPSKEITTVVAYFVVPIVMVPTSLIVPDFPPIDLDLALAKSMTNEEFSEIVGNWEQRFVEAPLLPIFDEQERSAMSSLPTQVVLTDVLSMTIGVPRLRIEPEGVSDTKHIYFDVEITNQDITSNQPIPDFDTTLIDGYGVVWSVFACGGIPEVVGPGQTATGSFCFDYYQLPENLNETEFYFSVLGAYGGHDNGFDTTNLIFEDVFRSALVGG